MVDSLTLQFEKQPDGLWFVTGGERIFIAHRDLDAILTDLPNVLRRFFDDPGYSHTARR